MIPLVEQGATGGLLPCIWLPDIVDCIARFLPANEVACTLRLVDKATSQQLEKFKAIRLSLPTPPHVFKARWGSPAAFRAFSYKQRLALLCLVAASGSLANMQVALNGAGLLVRSEALEAAAEAAQLDICRALHELGHPWGVALASAAGRGHAHVCEWLLDAGCPFEAFAFLQAARGGHEALTLSLVKHHPLFHNSGTDGDGEGDDDDGNSGVWRMLMRMLFHAAAEGCSLAALQRLHAQLLSGPDPAPAGGEEGQQPPPPPPAAAEPPVQLTGYHRAHILAAAAGSPTPDWRDKVEWLEGLGYERGAEASESAAEAATDAADRLRWLHGRGYPLHDRAASRAAERGDMAALRALQELWGAAATAGADASYPALHGHLETLRFLATAGVEMTAQDVACTAATGGHLHVVAWAVEELGGGGVVSPEDTKSLLDVAVGSGNLELVAWLRERGWGWSARTLTQAAWGGCEEALEWLVAQGCPFPADGRPYVNAALQRDLATVRCLHRLGCPWRPKLLNDCIRRATPVPMLGLLRALGCPADWAGAARQAQAMTREDYRSDLLAWLAEEPQQQLLQEQLRQRKQKRSEKRQRKQRKQNEQP